MVLIVMFFASLFHVQHARFTLFLLLSLYDLLYLYLSISILSLCNLSLSLLLPCDLAFLVRLVSLSCAGTSRCFWTPQGGQRSDLDRSSHMTSPRPRRPRRPQRPPCVTPKAKGAGPDFTLGLACTIFHCLQLSELWQLV